MKKGIKRNLVKSFKDCIFRFMIIQKVLLVTIAMLKRSSSKLKLKSSIILQHVLQLKTKMITMIAILTNGLQLINVHASKKRKQTIIVLFVSVLSILNLFVLNTISGQLLVRNNLYSYGSVQIQTIGVTAYRDVSCTTTVSSVAWGTLTPGRSSTNTIYVKNEGTSSLTLSLDTTNWYPASAPNYIALNWDYNGQTIAPNQVIQITLTLSVSQTISGISSFNFEIIIDGTG